jgi:drug/metabolite transporter (DMT)-like permease
MLLLLLSVLWGGSFFFVEVALTDLPPLTLVAARLGLAALAMLLALRLGGGRLGWSGRLWAAFAVMALLNNVLPFTLLVSAQRDITGSLAAILNATTPLWTVLVAHVATSDEKATFWKLAGVLTGLAGVAVVVAPDALGGLGDSLPAQLACLAAALSYALAGLFGRRFKHMGAAPLQTATGQVVAGTLIMIPIALSVEAPWTLATPAPATLASVAALAVLSTGLAYLVYFRLLASAGATNLLLVTLLIPVTATLLGALVLGEALTAFQGLGMGLIALGLAAVDGRLPRRLTRRRAGAKPVDPAHFQGADI